MRVHLHARVWLGGGVLGFRRQVILKDTILNVTNSYNHTEWNIIQDSLTMRWKQLYQSTAISASSLLSVFEDLLCSRKETICDYPSAKIINPKHDWFYCYTSLYIFCMDKE